MLHEINSQSSFSKSYACPMSNLTDGEWRRKRLADLSKMKGGNAALGRLLGFRDGAYIGQMISGVRPITEKLIEKIHCMHGLHAWFSRESWVQLHAVRESHPPLGWPFKRVTEEEWKSIPEHKREVIEEQLIGLVAAQRASKRAA